MPMQSAALRPQRPRPSAPVKPEKAALTYQWEPFRAFVNELPPLFQQHWREIALNKKAIPLDPDWDRYFQYDLVGILRCLTARNANGTLVGYHFVLVYPHLHYASTLWAQSDIFWLDPAYRSGWWGIGLLKIVRDRLKEAGVKKHHVNIKLHFEAERGTLAKLLKRLGYEPIETVHSITLG